MASDPPLEELRTQSMLMTASGPRHLQSSRVTVMRDGGRYDTISTKTSVCQPTSQKEVLMEQELPVRGPGELMNTGSRNPRY